MRSVCGVSCLRVAVTFRRCSSDLIIFFFNDTATTEIYTLSLHDALPIYSKPDKNHASADLVHVRLPHEWFNISQLSLNLLDILFNFASGVGNHFNKSGQNLSWRSIWFNGLPLPNPASDRALPSTVRGPVDSPL